MAVQRTIALCGRPFSEKNVRLSPSAQSAMCEANVLLDRERQLEKGRDADERTLHWDARGN